MSQAQQPEGLIAELRKYAPHDPGVWPCHEAANEMERMLTRISELESWQETVRSNSPLLAELRALREENAALKAAPAAQAVEPVTSMLTFVNGEPAKCGCHFSYSDGGGEYSNVGRVTLCTKHAGTERNGATPMSPATPGTQAAGAPQAVLDSNWKARMLDGRAIERDEMGFGEHPELPMLDEGMKPRAFFAALGVELMHTMAEDDLELDEHEAMNGAGNWNAWTPRPPAGEGWRLVAIFDTEDGTAAWWARNALTARATPRGA